MKDAGVDPSDPRVRALAARSRELVAMFTGGRAAVAGQVKERYETDPAVRERGGVDLELMDYLGRAGACGSV